MTITVDDVLNSPVVVSPYKKFDCAILADGAAAIVISSERWAEKNSIAWRDRPKVYFAGTGCGTERVRLGDRPQPYPGYAHFRAKREAAAEAYEMAGIKDPLKNIDVAEVADTFTGTELQTYEALGFCKPGLSGPLSERGVFDIGGELPTNTSGGLIGQGAPPGAVGIAQGVEILGQLRGERPDSTQVKDARTGLMDIHGGTSSYAGVSIFSRED